ncbi:HAD family hydrolase [Spongiactinospora sp. 9N601]|uniref:HAD family hydrolase n=1 Tax=Spongiactinospora sp. 9N601 TaxID=3375149 RepID=UPI0037B2F050
MRVHLEDEGVKVAVLDMAGTTVEENGSVPAAVERALRSVGVPPAPARLRELRGMPKQRMFELIVPDAIRARAAYEEFVRAVVEAVRSGTVTAKPGAPSVFGRLRAHGIKIALITGFPREIRDLVLEELGWSGFADLVLSPEDVGRGRPYPDLVWAAAARLEATGVRSTLVAGDTRNDLLAAYRAGVPAAIGVLGGAHDEDELRRVPHAAIISGIAELPNAIALD